MEPQNHGQSDEHRNHTASAQEGNPLPEPVSEASEIIDVEEYSKSNRQPPKGRQYRIRVDRESILVHSDRVTGREILTLAGKVPPEAFILRQKFRGGRLEKIGLDQEVNLTAPGVECFKTLSRDQTEG